MAESLDARLARLEGSYEQIDRRLGSIDERLGRLESKVDSLASDFRREIGAVNTRLDGLDRSLNARIDGIDGRVNGRIDTLHGRITALLYGIIVAILAPIAIRVFFP